MHGWILLGGAAISLGLRISSKRVLLYFHLLLHRLDLVRELFEALTLGHAINLHLSIVAQSEQVLLALFLLLLILDLHGEGVAPRDDLGLPLDIILIEHEDADV